MTLKIEVFGFHRPELLDRETYINRWVKTRVDHQNQYNVDIDIDLSNPDDLEKFKTKEHQLAEKNFENKAIECAE